MVGSASKPDLYPYVRAVQLGSLTKGFLGEL